MTDLEDDEFDDESNEDGSDDPGSTTPEMDEETRKLAEFVAKREPTIEEVLALDDDSFREFLAKRDERRPELIEQSREPVEPEPDPFEDSMPMNWAALSDEDFAKALEIRELGKIEGMTDAEIEAKYRVALVGKFGYGNEY